MQRKLKNQIYTGANSRQSLYDLTIPENWNKKLIVFIHGYMGYKDWGCWNLVSDFFANENFGFLKYNASHNGGTIENPIDFDDLDAFSENNYSKEIEDFEAILKVVESEFENQPEIYIIGHSRGGGIALLQSQNDVVARIVSWAGIASIATRFPSGEQLEAWKKNGYYIRENGRTKQQMPHSYSQYEDFLTNKNRLDIEKYCRNSMKPTLVIHGDEDQSVNIEEGEQIASWLKSQLIPITGAQHTFSASQPWSKDVLPQELEVVCKLTLQFFNLDFSSKNDLKAEKMSMMAELVKLARADKEVRTEEIQFLTAIALDLGISDTDFKRIVNEHIDFVVPHDDASRILQFQRLVLLLFVDFEVSDKEVIALKTVGMNLGLSPDAVDGVLEKMKENGGKALSMEELKGLFGAGLN
ncbi:MAG: prolyl oligopeptidase family serine peptidase [Fluviicola sp.]|nr:prolyl oligopeptidase family serine peptidase [Fluviicola sp.]